MNKLTETIEKLDDLDLIDMDIEFGFSSLELVYSHSDHAESEVKLSFNNIIYLRYFGGIRHDKGSLYIGQSSLLDINKFLDKSKDIEINKHIKKLLSKGNTLEYFYVEGEVYIEVICLKIEINENNRMRTIERKTGSSL